MLDHLQSGSIRFYTVHPPKEIHNRVFFAEDRNKVLQKIAGARRGIKE